MINIKTLEQLPERLEKIKEVDLTKYDTSHGIDLNYRRIYYVFEEGGKEIGIMNTYSAFSEIYIDDMWIHTDFRGKGYGRLLVERLEEDFKGKGFNNINLVTSEFSAPDFYKKCGFELEFTRVNKKNPKLTKYFFVKYFNEEIENQGLILEI